VYTVRQKIILNIFLHFIGPLHLAFNITLYTQWKQTETTVLGGNGQGNKLNQLSYLQHIYVDDDDQNIYIDSFNDHIMDWKLNANNGQIVAGGNGQGNLPQPSRITTDVIIDKKNDSLIICDNGNKQEVLWSCPNSTIRRIIITNIDSLKSNNG
jgi:hypothetical protein